MSIQSILGSVGRGARNSRQDVGLIQMLLNADLPAGMPKLVIDGLFGPKTLAALSDFQRRHGINPSGLVSPGDSTWLRLTGPTQPAPPAPAPTAPTGTWNAKFTFEQFWAFTEPLEGGFAADCMFMVKDLQVATGMGITFSNRANRASGLPMAQALDWVYKPGHPSAGQKCSAADITRDYDVVLGMEDIGKQGSGFLHIWKNATNCRITKEGMQQAVRTRIIFNINYVKTKRADPVGDFDRFPADAQLCIASLSWSGNEFRFPNFCKACRSADWFTAEKECRFKSTEGTHGRRSDQQQLMMHNAGCTALGVANPEILHFPARLAKPSDPSSQTDGRLGYRESHQISRG